MILKIINKSIVEQLRSPVVIILSLITAPLFVMLYAVFFPSDYQTYNVVIINNDIQGSELKEHISNWSPNTNRDEPIIILQEVNDQNEGIEKIRNGDGDLLLIIPKGYTESLYKVERGELEQAKKFEFIGDLSDPLYSVAVIMAYSAIDSYASEIVGIMSPLTMSEKAIGRSDSLNELDLYIPGLLIFSLIILIFQVAMSLSGLVEGGILKRLRLTKVSTFEILFGYSSSIIIFGILAFFLTLLTARLFGSTLSGNWILVGVVALLTALAITGSGMIISAFSPTVSGAFIMANFPLMLFMFFSGSIFPMDKVEIFRLGSTTVGLFDILPTTHAVNALHQVLVLQASFHDIFYEVLSLIILTVLYVFIGVRLYYKKHICL